MSLTPPGFFGKVPARGDFIIRRVCPALATRWDEWLTMLTVAVRDAAGDLWPDAWLTAPIWHFALGAAIVPPVGAAGVLVASVDRVGRMFPFSAIGRSDGVPDRVWFNQIEALVLDALDDDFDPDALDRALLQLGIPEEDAALPPETSLWWCLGSDRVAATRFSCTGLPDSATAITMVLGDTQQGSIRD
jgi:type VI secretion system protein ImpM